MSDDGYFDADVAASYDKIHGGSANSSVAEVVALLAELAAGGPALEFAIGTGRIGLPLSERGISVSGIELSQAMVAELRKKEQGQRLPVQIGDMTSTHLGQQFSLVFLVYNTIDNLTSQQAQLACFENAAAHLVPGGRFLVETLVPPIQKLPFGETLLAHTCTNDHWSIDEFDVVTQRYISHHLRTSGEQTSQLSIPFRYAWPAEFDLMARIAGLDLEHRWGDWQKAPFTSRSSSHVSVWRKPS